ncbi:MAG: fasciclin domain-containing protein [Bacteroidetes bacterium]|nr:fasciclin domain-containing protein [Bacteroidota bacterium]
MKKRTVIWLFAIAVILLISCQEEKELTLFVSIEEQSIGAYLEENRDTYSLFYEVAKKAGILEPLKLYNPYGDGRFTLFLPGNDAFEEFISQSDFGSVDDLINNQDVLEILARYHVVASSFKSADFPFGSLGDSTFTGEYLYMGFDEELNYRVNNGVDIVQLDLELSNGYIHIVDGVLEPIISNSYEYLLEREEYSVITELFEITGLTDTMGIFRTTETGKTIRNYYTLFVETDEVFARFGIHNIDSLITRYATPGLEYTDPENGLYQYAAYHMLEGGHAINDFEDVGPFVTYAYNPVSIDATQDIIINKGIPVFDTIVVAGDTIPLNYIRVDLYNSNGFSLNGPVHTLRDPMVIQKPTGAYEFQFYNEPVILENMQDETVSPLEFTNPSEMVNLSWTGVESIYYLAGINGPTNQDCLFMFGNFTLEYTTPNVASGAYEIWLRINRGSQSPQIKLFIDGIQQQSIVDLTLGRSGFRSIQFGNRRFEDFGPHTIRIETVVGGELYWDWIQFRPIN